MSPSAWAVDLLLGFAALLALGSAVGVLAMPDPFQKLHFIAPPSTLGAFAIAAAVFVGDKDKQAGAKALFAAVLLALMNGVVTHATARAARIRAYGDWALREGEKVEIHGPPQGSPATTGEEPR